MVIAELTGSVALRVISVVRVMVSAPARWTATGCGVVLAAVMASARLASTVIVVPAPETVGARVGASVLVAVAVSVAVGTSVLVAVAVSVAVGASVLVAVAVSVAVGASVLVAVAVSVAVGVLVAVRIGRGRRLLAASHEVIIPKEAPIRR